MRDERREWLEKERDRLKALWRSLDEALADAKARVRDLEEQADDAHSAYLGLGDYLNDHYPKGP